MLQIMSSRKAIRKPLSFSTTMRNPNRIVEFLNCILPYENQILTHDVIMKIVQSIIREKIYTPRIVRGTGELKEILKSEDKTFSDEQIEKIIEDSPQKHKEAEYAYGWDSRFETIYKLPKEFGFVKYAMGEPIIISATGHMLIDAMNEKEPNEEKIRAVFLNSMMKYQTNNPYRKNANSNVPLVLLLQVLKLLKEDKEENGAGVFVKELSLFICWPDNDYKKLYHEIKNIRKEVGYNYSDEYMYDICLKLLGVTHEQENRFKMSQICKEAVDEYIRKMRSTGVISLRGNGRFVDYNTWEIEKINYILENYSKYEEFKSKDEYFEYMGSVDTVIINMESNIPEDITDIRKQTLERFASEYSKEDIYTELHDVCNKKESKDPVFRFLPNPVRLEFLTSIAMQQNFDNLDVIPNYSIDDEGLPTNTASGGKADIICIDSEYESLVEVTLMCGRQDQVVNEILPIRRHLMEEKKTRENVFSLFIAPVIHEDAKEAAKWYNHSEQLDIVTLDINSFIEKIKELNYIKEML